MGNLMLEAYFKLDNLLVSGANKAVKAWNWTTGRTRADLADVFSVSGFTILPFSVAMEPSQISTIGILSLVGILTSHKAFHEIDKNYERAQNRKALIRDPKRDAYFLKIGGMFVGFGGLTAIKEPLIGVGATGIGTAYYIMRADYQSPRKDVISRAIDGLSKKLRNYQPAPQPIPSPIWELI